MIRLALILLITFCLSSCAVYNKHIAKDNGYNVDLTPDNNGENWK